MPQNRKLLWAVLAGCTCIAFFTLAYPIYVIRPFRAQGTNELAAALAVQHWKPFLVSLASAIAVIAAVMLWRGSSGRLPRMFSAAAMVLTISFAALSQINIYEKMFHRIESPETIPADQAKLESDDMVLAIRAGGQARAYPIRMMGYHHIVNDRLGKVPVAATY